MLAEIARRTGEVETLGRAASAALRARELARRDRRSMPYALIGHARIIALGATLFGDDEAAASARQWPRRGGQFLPLSRSCRRAWTLCAPRS